MGEHFWAMHHHCWGLIRFRRSEQLGVPPVVRRGLLRHAIGDFEFVTKSMPRDFIMAPEIFTYTGRAHLLLNESGLAERAFINARKAKPDYWPAYSWWSTYLINNGRREEARELIEEGLRHSPDSKVLLNLRADLEAKIRLTKPRDTGKEQFATTPAN